MSIISAVARPNVWEQICHEFQQQRQEMERLQQKNTTSTTSTVLKTLSPSSCGDSMQAFDPSKHHPAFYGKPFAQVEADFNVQTELDPAVGHPACASYWIADQSEMRRKAEDVGPDRKTCSSREFLEFYVWPCLMPALESMLVESKRQGCFGLKKVMFNCMDFLTEYLYNHNPLYNTHPSKERLTLPLLDIPFVKQWLDLHPRPPRPVSLTWTEDETATKIQSAWRAWRVRRDPDVQELRKWQEDWRFINRQDHIQQEVSGFWERMMPDYSSMSISLGRSVSRISYPGDIRTNTSTQAGRGGGESESTGKPLGKNSSLTAPSRRVRSSSSLSTTSNPYSPISPPH